MLFVTKWTVGSKYCDQEDQDQLECFDCANTAGSTSKHCSNDTNELYGNWIQKNLQKSASGTKNDSRYAFLRKYRMNA